MKLSLSFASKKEEINRRILLNAMDESRSQDKVWTFCLDNKIVAGNKNLIAEKINI